MDRCQKQLFAAINFAHNCPHYANDAADIVGLFNAVEHSFTDITVSSDNGQVPAVRSEVRKLIHSSLALFALTPNKFTMITLFMQNFNCLKEV